MPVRIAPEMSALRALAALSAFLPAGLALVPQAASALEDPFGISAPPRPRPPRPRPPARMRPPAAPPALPPAEVVTGYLPRNNNLPMYNEPPRRGPAW